MEGGDDGEVIRASLADATAFGVIFERYHARIVGYLACRVGPDVAEDLASEVFLAAFRQRASFRKDTANAAPWLYGIAINLVRHWRRSNVRRRRAYCRAAGSSSTWIDPDVDSRVDAERCSTELGWLIGCLSNGDRDVLLLFALAELSYPEIAEALSIPLGTVRSRLSRTRHRLQHQLRS